MKTPDRVGTIETLLCPTCNHRTEHALLYTYDTYWRNDIDDAIHGGETHDFLSCNGCKSGTYRIATWSSEDDPREILYPLRSDETRPLKQFRHTPWDGLLDNVYKETVTALNSGSVTLAGAGVRLLIEGICKAEGIIKGPLFDKKTGLPVINSKTGQPAESKSLEGQINGMAQRDLVSKKQAAHLHEIRFLGNEAAHQLYRPESKVINFALDIVEHVIEQVYEQPHKAKVLSERKRP